MKTLKLLLIALIPMTLWSCQQIAEEPPAMPLIQTDYLEAEGIDPFSSELSAIDAKFVAKTFVNKNKGDSRSDFGKKVKSVIPIIDSNG